MAARSSTVIGVRCSFAVFCLSPSNQLMTRCSATCSQMIHPSCAKYDKCPFHVSSSAMLYDLSILIGWLLMLHMHV
jgi:hypothetical protein